VKKTPRLSADGGDSVRLTIRGMTCTHCARSVRRALSECSGVQEAKVDLAGGEATVRGEDIDLAALHRSLEELGYNVVADRELP